MDKNIKDWREITTSGSCNGSWTSQFQCPCFEVMITVLIHCGWGKPIKHKIQWVKIWFRFSWKHQVPPLRRWILHWVMQYHGSCTVPRWRAPEMSSVGLLHGFRHLLRHDRSLAPVQLSQLCLIRGNWHERRHHPTSAGSASYQLFPL